MAGPTAPEMICRACYRPIGAFESHVLVGNERYHLNGFCKTSPSKDEFTPQQLEQLRQIIREEMGNG